jgi:hypothetical protein
MVRAEDVVVGFDEKLKPGRDELLLIRIDFASKTNPRSTDEQDLIPIESASHLFFTREDTSCIMKLR